MKTIKNAVLMVLTAVGIANAQEVNVQSSSKLNTDFKKYKTFGWMQQGQSTSPDRYVAYTYEGFSEPLGVAVPASKADTKKNGKPKHHVRANGNPTVYYSYSVIVPASDPAMNTAIVGQIEDQLVGRGYHKSQSTPDLLVAYKVFDKQTKIKGYNDVPNEANGTQYREASDTTTFNLQPGTLLISFVDSKSGETVWEGFASGLDNNEDIINDSNKVKEAINLIFSKYGYRADGVGYNQN